MQQATRLRYVTSLHARATRAHIGYPVTLCNTVLTYRHQVTEELPAGRSVCTRCARVAAQAGLLASGHAAQQRFGPAPRAVDEELIALLIAGLTDNQIAARVAVSVRHVVRRVAAIRARYGASSRFQLGYRIGVEHGRNTPPA